MEITVITPTNSQSKCCVGLLRDAAKFFGRVLLGRRMAKHIILDIEIDNKIDVKGELINEDSTKRSRWFTIVIQDGLGIDELLATLAHEMVHLKQHVRNEITFRQIRATRGHNVSNCTEIRLWQGKEWKPGKYEDEYFDAPWEIIAYGMEQTLVHKFHTRHDPEMPWYDETST